MQGAMDMKVKTAREVMTPLEDAYMLEESCKLSFAVVRDIFDHGFSRVPVYARERQHVVGLLFVKDLIFVDPEDEVPLAEYLRVFERSIELVDGRDAVSREAPSHEPTRRRHAIAAMAYGLGHSYPPARHRRVARDEPRRWRAVDATPSAQPSRISTMF